MLVVAATECCGEVVKYNIISYLTNNVTGYDDKIHKYLHKIIYIAVF